MKHQMKKSLSILLAIVMLLGVMCLPGLAADKADVSNHTYNAYQIFQGSLGTNGKMGQIEWGTGVNGSALLADLKSSMSAFSSCISAADAAKVIANLGVDDLKTVEKIVYRNRTSTPSLSGVKEGDSLYLNNKAGYYLLVDSTATSNVENGVKNLLILKVTDASGIQIDSKVDVPSVEKKVLDANDTHPITEEWQDSADYDIGDTVPFQLTAKLATISDYETYKVVFNDTLSAGLTYKGNAKVYVNGIYKTNITGSTSQQGNGQTNLTFTIDDVKSGPYGAVDNAVITVEYDAELNTNAVCGSAGNPNTVYLQYSNNPFDSGRGNNNLGKTPEDKVIVFTYTVVINKVDEQNNPLTGAKFTLSKKDANGTYQSVAEIDGANLSTFTWKGIDDGEYKLEETGVPAGFNKAEDVLFTVTATHDKLAADPQLKTLTCDPSALSVNFTDGIITGTIQNQPGETLPETGGTGTTVFYVLGGLLLLGAGVVLVAKRRMVD